MSGELSPCMRALWGHGRVAARWDPAARRAHRRRSVRVWAFAAVAAIVGALLAVPSPELQADGSARAIASEEPGPRHHDSSRARWPATASLGAGRAAGDTVITPPPAVFDAPAAATAPPPPALRQSSPAVRAAGGVWAVVIGIDDYPGSRSDLRAAVNDARDVDAALELYGVPAERRLLLLDRQAAAATITAALDWLVARAGPGSTAVFFYAGHVRKLGAGSETMVGADGGLVRDTDLATRLAGLESSRTWLAIAGCYGGGFAEALAPGRILTAASDADSLAYENAAYGRSYLVEFMVRRAMIEGRAGESIEASFAWAVDALRREHPDRAPVQYDHADGDVRLGAPPASAAPPAPEPPPKQEPAPAEPGTSPEDGRDDCVLELGSLVGCGDRR